MLDSARPALEITMYRNLPPILLLLAVLGGCTKKVQQVPPPAPRPLGERQWSDTHPPFRPVSIAAIGNTLWICGADEMIASSSDGGTTWRIKHQNRGGRGLVSIGFVNEKLGHASGDSGLLLSTRDGGETWLSQDLGTVTVRTFSFSDAAHGIAVLSDRVGRPEIGILSEVQGVPFLQTTVKVTSDGGQHWQEASALKMTDELRLYTEVLSAAALDPMHYLLGIRQPQVAVGYAVTTDGGNTWKLVHLDNVFATKVFVHDGEYWAFGIEYLNREKGGGYGAPVSLHSTDGRTWVHGVRGPSEFSSCTSQGCYLWDGVVEDLYGEQPKFWVLPQDGTMTREWAIAKSHACMIDGSTKCGPAEFTEHLLSHP